jgi:CBS domain-containing protein
LIGMVCLRDLNKRKREDWGSSTVREIMRPVEQLATVSPRDEAFEVLALFGQRDVTQLPVVEDDGRLVGLIRREDILKWLSLHAGPGQPMPSPT